jgi:hypothetical protein
MASAAQITTSFLFVCGPSSINLLAQAAGISAKLMTTCLENAFVVRLLTMYWEGGGNSVYPVDDMLMRVGAGDDDDGEFSAASAVNMSRRMAFYINDCCAAIDSNWKRSAIREDAVRQQVLDLSWSDVCDEDQSFADVLRKFYEHLKPTFVSTRQLLGLVQSHCSLLRHNIAIGKSAMLAIVLDGQFVWVTAAGIPHSYDEPADDTVTRFYFVVVKEMMSGDDYEIGSFTITGQTAANIPFYNLCRSLNQHLPPQRPELAGPRQVSRLDERNEGQWQATAFAADDGRGRGCQRARRTVPSLAPSCAT